MVGLKKLVLVVRALVIVYATLCTVFVTVAFGFAARETYRERHRPVYVFPADTDRERFEGR